jgi:hypothetical protein
MAGCLTTGLVKVCDAIKSGGASSLHLTDRTNVVSLTIAIDGTVTGITMVALEVFLKFEFKANSAQFVEDATNEGGLQVTQTFNQIWESFDQNQRNILMELAACNCGMVAIHRENTGKSWLWGFDETEEVYLFGANRDSGTAKSDPNQVAPVLQALATSFAREFTGVIPV